MGLGAFALILSMLPPQLVRAAAFASGFEVSRDAGIQMLRTCADEDGLYAPIAALMLMSFVLDTKTFLGEPQTEEVTCPHKP